MRVLVAFGSKRRGTEELARAVGESLTAAGHEVTVRCAHPLDGLEPWDAVVLGGGLYAGRWQRNARRFVERHQDELRLMPVWLFSSGPLDDSASKTDIPPTRQVEGFMKRTGARGHVTFGGRLAPDARGFIAGAMARKGHAGDWRNMEAAKVWGRGVAAELASLPAARTERPRIGTRARLLVRRALAALCLFTGLTAIVGGGLLFIWPLGPPGLGLPLSVLEQSPFTTFLVPGLLLCWAVGIPNLAAGILAARRHVWGERAGAVGGAAITIWIATEMVMLRSMAWLQALYLVVGLLTLAASCWLWTQRRAVLRGRRAPTPRPPRGHPPRPLAAT